MGKGKSSSKVSAGRGYVSSLEGNVPGDDLLLEKRFRIPKIYEQSLSNLSRVYKFPQKTPQMRRYDWTPLNTSPNRRHILGGF